MKFENFHKFQKFNKNIRQRDGTNFGSLICSNFLLLLSNLETFSKWSLHWENVSTFMKCLSLSSLLWFFSPILTQTITSPHLFRCFFIHPQTLTVGTETEATNRPQISIWQLFLFCMWWSTRKFNSFPHSPATTRWVFVCVSFYCFDIYFSREIYDWIEFRIGNIKEWRDFCIQFVMRKAVKLSMGRRELVYKAAYSLPNTIKSQRTRPYEAWPWNPMICFEDSSLLSTAAFTASSSERTFFTTSFCVPNSSPWPTQSCDVLLFHSAETKRR